MNIMVVLFFILVRHMTMVAGRQSSGFATETWLTNVSLCGISPEKTQNKLLLISDLALTQMASINESLRHLLANTGKAPGVKIYETRICTSYDTEKKRCVYETYGLLQPEMLDPTAAISHIKPRLHVCGIGTGESGCGSFRNRTSPCGTISYETLGVDSTRRCEWIIHVDGLQVLLSFKYINISYCGSQCLCDSVNVYDNLDFPEEKQPFCGYRKDFKLITRFSMVRISFEIYKAPPGKGFLLNYQAMRGADLRLSPPVKLTANNGTFSIPPALPGTVDGETYIFEWYIRIDELKIINLTWHLNTTCHHEYNMTVAAYEGPFEAGIPLKAVSVNTFHQDTMLSNGFQLHMRLIQPRFCRIQRFDAYYEGLQYTLGSDRSNAPDEDFLESREQFYNVTLSTKEAPAPIFRFYQYKCRPDSYLSINITGYQFRGPNIDNCAYEGFLLWTGYKNSDKYGPFCGKHIDTTFFNAIDQIENIGPVIHSSSNTLNVFFYSYGHTNGTQLTYNVTVSKCIGIFYSDGWKNLIRSRLFNYKYSRTGEQSDHETLNLSLAHDTCHHIQALPSDKPCNRRVILRLMNGGEKRYHKITYYLTQSSPAKVCELDDILSKSLENTKLIDHCNCAITARGYLLGISSVKEQQFSLSLHGRLNHNPLSIEKAKRVLISLIRPKTHTIHLKTPLDSCYDHYYVLTFKHPSRNLPLRPLLVRVNEFIKDSEFFGKEFQVDTDIMPYQYGTAFSCSVKTTIKGEGNFTYYLEYQLKPNQELPPNPDENDCPSGMVRFKHSCYQYYKNNENDTITWTEAKKECERNGGMLLSLDGKLELSFIKLKLKEKWMTGEEYSPVLSMTEVIYIGLEATNKGDHWIDETPAAFTEWYKPLPGKRQIFTEPLFGDGFNFAPPLLMQPSNDPSSKCTAMVVVSPSMPTQWFRIPCQFPLPDSSFICEYRFNKAENQSKQNETQSDGDGMKTYVFKEGNLTRIVPSTKRCPTGYTAREGSCFKLVSSTEHIDRDVSCSTAKEMCTEEMGHMAVNGEVFQLDLLNIWLHTPEYGNIWIGDCHQIMYNYTTSKWTVLATNQTITGFANRLNVVCETAPLNVTFACGLGQFVCNDGTCISDIQRCDGKRQCPNGDDEDGSQCDCPNSAFRCENGKCIPFSKYCDFIQDCKDNSDEENCTFSHCPLHYSRCDNGQCIETSRFGDYKVDCLDASDEKDEYTDKSSCGMFRCYSGKCLPKSLVKNMRPDCPGSVQEDESIDVDDMKRRKWKTVSKHKVVTKNNMEPYCPMGNGSLTRCRLDHIRCFERHRACIYDVDEYGYMASCPDGDHLRHCKTFECPNMFKCPESYCVPYQKICDGKPDCPDGHDEKKCVDVRCSIEPDDSYGHGDGNCTTISCPGLFKCSKEGICLDQSLVCDGTVHCKTSFDDEAACPYTKCPFGCVCKGRSVNCTNLTNDTMFAIPFDVRILSLLPIENRSLGDLQADWFKDFIHLGKLNLKGLGIKYIRQGVFKNLNNLLTLDLRNNDLRTIKKGMFVGLKNLQHLQLSGNPVQSLGEDAFKGLTSIRYLNLDNLEITSVADGCFRSLHKIVVLSLLNNSIRHVSARTWTGLSSLRTLYLKENAIKQVPRNMFENSTLKVLHTDHFKLCCLDNKKIQCTPTGDAFSSCEDLLANSVLKVLIWVLGVAAVVGNLVVIITRLVTERKQVSSILIVNLSVSDLLMGVYLLIIASADVLYRDKYYTVADDWRAGGICKFAGFLSTLSSEMSVFMLVLIAADRLVSIVFTFEARRLTLKTAFIIMAAGWIIFSTLSALPVLGLPYFGENYIKSGVCLLFHITAGKSRGWEYTTFIFLLLNLIGVLFLFFSYMYIYWFMNEKRKQANRDATDKEFELAQTFVLIIATDFLCWLPLVCTAFTSLSGIHINQTVSVWMAVVILPINSALNPFLYTFNALQRIRKNRKRRRNKVNQK